MKVSTLIWPWLYTNTSNMGKKVKVRMQTEILDPDW